MTTTLLCALLVVMTFASRSSPGEAVLKCDRDLLVHVPRMSLNAGERVVGFKLTVVNGWVVGVSNIPRDWGVSVEPEVGGLASVYGSPQHGAGAPDSTDALPSVVVRGHNCSTSEPRFAVSAIVHVTRDFASTRTIELQQGMLRIE